MRSARLQVLLQTALRQSVFAVFLNSNYLSSHKMVLDHRSDNTYVYDLRTIIAHAGLDLSIIKEFYLVNGPGFFTGIRSGVMIAKAIHQILKPRVFLISSFAYLRAHIHTKPEHYGILIVGSQREGYFQEFSPQGDSKAIIIPYAKAQEKARHFPIYTDQEKYSVEWGLNYLEPQAVFPSESKEIVDLKDLIPNYVRSEDELFQS